jgi:hypothetical protein
MWALFLAVVLAVPEPPPPVSPPRPCLYEPLPWVEWPRGIDLEEVAPVVVVAARHDDAEHPVLFGNGVIIEARDANSRVLTCAHLVRAKSKDAIEIRVGVFRHSFVTGARERAEYQEFDARLLQADDGLDLAMLEIPAGGTRAARVSSGSRRHGQRSVVSIVPFGRPTLIRSFHPYLHKGQSGSPDLGEGVVLGLAQGCFLHEGKRMHGLESFVDAVDIQSFLEERRDYPPNLCDPSV